jgi:membrane associated rhomboid family serine protease
MMILVVILVLGCYALYTMNGDERTRLKERVVLAVERARRDAARRRAEPEPFRDALVARTPWPIVMPALIAVNVLVFLGMGWGGTDQATLLEWGASFGPRTTNGEWWRLLASLFVHGGFLQLVVNCAALAQLGLVLERLVGHATFGAVYLAAGLLASLVGLSDYPMATSYGASGGIFGLYGLLVASSAWTAVHRSRPANAEPEPQAAAPAGLFGLREVAGVGEAPEADAVARTDIADGDGATAGSGIAITLTAARELVPVAALFLLYNLASASLGAGAELGGFAAGFICGVVLTSAVSVRTPPVPRVAVAMAATVAVAIVSAVPLRGMADVRPEITRVLDIETRTSGAYQSAMAQYRLGTVSADGLAQVIEKTITPELQAMQSRLKTLGRVPPEHLPLLSGAEEYLRLRDESWRLRAAALHKSSMQALRKADSVERASLEALERLRPPDEEEKPRERAGSE